MVAIRLLAVVVMIAHDSLRVSIEICQDILEHHEWPRCPTGKFATKEGPAIGGK